MSVILPPDGGPIAVYKGTFSTNRGQLPEVLVRVDVAEGPSFTLTPHQWNDLVRRIRAARTAREVGA